jgi:uncharacterized protein YecT (DUF1311 family)
MMRALIFAAYLAFSLSAHAQRPQCVRAGSQGQMVSCAGEDAEAADKELNSVYDALLQCAGHDKLFIERLRTSQRLWVRFRDAELEAYQPVDEEAGEVSSIKWGSMYPLTYLSAKKTLTDERTVQLRRFFFEGFLDDRCEASNAAEKVENHNAED